MICIFGPKELEVIGGTLAKLLRARLMPDIKQSSSRSKYKIEVLISYVKFFLRKSKKNISTSIFLKHPGALGVL